jgi:hypothetical protein
MAPAQTAALHSPPEMPAEPITYIVFSDADAEAWRAEGLDVVTADDLPQPDSPLDEPPAVASQAAILLRPGDHYAAKMAPDIVDMLRHEAVDVRVVKLSGFKPKMKAATWIKNRKADGIDIAAALFGEFLVVEPISFGLAIADQGDDQGDDDQPDAEIIDRWPKLDRRAFHGVAGEIVAAVEPHTEADPAAILIQFLVAFGSMVGRGPHFNVGATKHYLNLFATIVGVTALGRKGTSWDIVKWAIGGADPHWTSERIQSGLVSGEGLIHHVRDERREVRKLPDGTETEVVVDEGVKDKRLLIEETELSRTLKAMNRESNTLSDVIRQAWDHGNMRTLGKQNPSKATGAHISIIGHTTQADIRKHLTETDAANGFANRFLWAAVRRSKVLPDGGDLGSVNWTPIHKQLCRATSHARGVGAMTRDHEATAMWAAVYPELSDGKPGLLGSVTSRAVPQTLRLACLYALLDGRVFVQKEHLTAAIALWEYCEASARMVFGESQGDPAADKLLAALKASPQGLTRKAIYADVFQNNKTSKVLATLLSDLLTQGLIHKRKENSTGGRPAERWFIGRQGVSLAG